MAMTLEAASQDRTRNVFAGSTHEPGVTQTEPTLSALPDPRLLISTEPTIKAIAPPSSVASPVASSVASPRLPLPPIGPRLPRATQPLDAVIGATPAAPAAPARSPATRPASPGRRTPPSKAAARSAPPPEPAPALDNTMNVKTTLFSPVTEPSPALPAPRAAPRRGTVNGHTIARAASKPRTRKALVTLGKYQLLRHLASGGMAHVFLARLDGVGGFSRHLVIKTLRRQHAHDPAHVAMFLDEARLLAALHHRNIAQVFDVGVTDDGTHYLAMDYIHGETLRTVMQQCHDRGLRLPLDFAITVIAGGAAALQHVHDRHASDGRWLQLVHRDVTPSNLMASYDDAITLIDFGIAKAAVRSTHTPVGFIKGKVGYMAPEQARGEAIDRRSDVFSLGVVLYELTTQVHPFAATAPQEVRKRVLRGEPTPPSQLIPGYPLALEQVVMTALAHEPKDRYPDCAAFARALTDAGACAGISPSPGAISRVLNQLFGAKVEPWFDGVELEEPAGPPPREPAPRDVRGSTALPATTPARPTVPRLPSRREEPRPIELISPRQLQQLAEHGQAAAAPRTPSTAELPTPRELPRVADRFRGLSPSHPLPEAPADLASCTPAPFVVPLPQPPALAALRPARPAVPQLPALVSPARGPEIPPAREPAMGSSPAAVGVASLLRQVAEMLLVAATLALLVLSHLTLDLTLALPHALAPAAPRPAPQRITAEPIAIHVPAPSSSSSPAPRVAPLVTAPAPPPAPTTFLLSVTSDPSDATVTLDGERLGRTPLVVAQPVRLGTAVVRIRHRGYRSRKLEINLGQDQTLQVHLRESEPAAEDLDGPAVEGPSAETRTAPSQGGPPSPAASTAPPAPSSGSLNDL